MTTTSNVQEILESLDFQTVDEMINSIYDNLKLSVAIFDEDGVLQGLCMKADRCKCYYMLLHGQPNQCSIFNPEFTKQVLDQKEVDRLCDFSCRLTSKEAMICGNMHKIIIFQYNLDTDPLDFNPTNSSDYTPLYKGDSTLVDYFWQPNIMDKEQRDIIFDFIIKNTERIKSYF